MKKFMISVGVLSVLSACAPPLPDSGAGVGFDNYADYQRSETGAALPPPSEVSSQPLSAMGESSALAPRDDAAALAAATRDTLQATSSGAGAAQAPTPGSSTAPAPVLNHAGISDENSFEAVDARRSIEGDAALIARNRAQYQVVEPTALPGRSGDAGPNLVEYALQTSNVRGQSIYRRFNLGGQARTARNCARYASPDLAQTAFLESGGPRRDRHALDPDGDGFACAWDPAPFRNAVNG